MTKGKDFEVWVTSIHGDRLVYALHSAHKTRNKAFNVAKRETHAVRSLIVEVKQQGKEIWCVAADRRGRAFNRMLNAGLMDVEGYASTTELYN